MISIYNKISDYIIIINNIGKINFCNESFLNKFNYKKEDVLNLNINKIIKNLNINNILKESKEINTTLECYSKCNKLVKLNANISKIDSDNNITIIAQEINSKPYTMEMLEDILDNIDTSVFIVDSDGKYLYINNALTKRFNKKMEDIIGTYRYEYYDDYTYNQLQKHDNEVISIKNPKIFNEKLNIRNNSYSHVSYKCPIFDENENLKYIVASTKDMSVDTIVLKEFYQNYNKLMNIDYINDVVNNDIDLDTVLKNICESVLDYIGADGVSVLLYDKDKEILIPMVKLKNSIINLEGVEYISLKKSDIDSGKFKHSFNCIMPIEKINIGDMKYNYMNNISYYGGYSIKINGEFIGIIGVNYKIGNYPKFNCDEYMKHICNIIAMAIKIIKLVEERDSENKKRKYSEKELEQFLDISVDMVAKIGIHGDIKMVSPNCHNILGWTIEELLSTSITDIAHPDDIYTFIGRDKLSYTDGKFDRQITRFKHKDGHYIYIEWSTTYLRDEKIYIATARDITKNLEMKNEMRLLEETVKLEATKNEFLSNMSHEFRTPINIILGTMQVINMNIQRNNIDLENLTRHTNYIKQNSYRLLRLVNNLIDINKMDMGAYELRCSNNNIVSIIEDITLSVSDYIKNNKINLIFDTNTEEVITYCDPDKIERIMLNLLSNAIKYTNDDGLIEVKINANEDEVLVSVKDNGIGIPKEKLDFIFNRFGQVDDSLNRMCEGSGIGLSLVKSLVELSGGNISVNSKIYEGSEFIFSIPIMLGQSNVIQSNTDRRLNHIERCNIEFSDIYDM